MKQKVIICLITLLVTACSVDNKKTVTIDEPRSIYDAISENTKFDPTQEVEATSAGDLAVSVLNFNNYKIKSYAYWMDGKGKASIINNGSAGNTLRIKGDGWRKIALPYTVTKNTILEFDFRSTKQGQIHGIGLAKENNYPNARFVYKIYGKKKWGKNKYNNYKHSASHKKHYIIPIGNDFKGDFKFLTFINDDDKKVGANSAFSNVIIYEKGMRLAENTPTEDGEERETESFESTPLPNSKPGPKPVLPTSAAKPKPSTPSRLGWITTYPYLNNVAATTYINVEGLNNQVNAPITFGQPFAKGDVPSGYTLVAGDDFGNVIDIQVDKKATFKDGSLRHAIISTVLNNSSSAGLALYAVPNTGSHGSTETTTDLKNTGLDVSVELLINGVLYTADLHGASISKPYSTWLSGSVVKDWEYKLPLVKANGSKHPHLQAHLNIRKYTGINNIRVDVTIENGWTFVSNPGNIDYDAQVFINNKLVYEKLGLTHYHHARWRKIFWTQNQPDLNVKHNISYLLASKAVPNYDQSVVISDATLQSKYNNWLASNHEPMGISFVRATMGVAGGRPDIGPLPGWAVNYLLSMDKRAKDVMLSIGDLSGSYPIHYKDKKTNQPVSIEKYPNVSLYFRTKHRGKNPLPKCGSSCSIPFSFDSAHQPSFAFLPYLVTGDLYYLESLQYWANINPLQLPDQFRDYSAGLFHRSQVRGMAWSLRTLGQVAAFTPDGESIKEYFLKILDNNIKVYNKILIGDKNNKLGVVSSGYGIPYNKFRGVSSWMDAFFTWSTGYLVELDFQQAKPLFAWKTKFPLSMMSDPGFCWLMATQYAINVRDVADAKPFRYHPTDQQPEYYMYSTIAEAYKQSVPASVRATSCNSPAMLKAYKSLNIKTRDKMIALDAMIGWPDSTLGHPALLQPALAVSVDYLGGNAGLNIWNKFDSRSKKPNYSSNPVWAIKPRILP